MKKIHYDSENPSIQKTCSFLDVPMSLLSDDDKKRLINAGYDLDDLADDQCVNVNYIDASSILAPWQIENSDSDYDWDCFHLEMCEILNEHPYYIVHLIDDAGKLDESNVMLLDNFDKLFERDEANAEDWLLYSNGEYAVFDEIQTVDNLNPKHYTIGVVGVDDYEAIPNDTEKFKAFLLEQVANSVSFESDNSADKL